MKVRAITIGQFIPYLTNMGEFKSEVDAKVKEASLLSDQLKTLFDGLNIDVQSSRICSQPIYNNDIENLLKHDLENNIKILEDQVLYLQNIIKDRNIAYFNSCSMIGDSLIDNDKNVEKRFLLSILDLIKKTENFFTSVQVASNDRGLNLSALHSCTDIIKSLSDPNPMDNLRFCVTFNLFPKTFTPFFPASSHHSKTPEFSLALEMADEVVKISENASNVQEFQQKMRDRFKEIYDLFLNHLGNTDFNGNFKFSGIDMSPAPFPTPEKSIGKALENLGVEHFGSLGSLLGVALITNSIPKELEKVIGFSGFMQPVLEDYTISERLMENKISIETLLLYSTICGTGLDCVPLPGTITSEELFSILLDLCTISLKLDKPLTARLMPIPGKQVGELVEFDFEYFAKKTRIIDFTRSKIGSKSHTFDAKDELFKFID